MNHKRESDALAAAKAEALRCSRCKWISSRPSAPNVALIPLVYGRTQVVYGDGCPTADLMFVGEAPGEDEDKKGEPFVGECPGQAGAILNDQLQRICVPRRDVYVTNLVKSRPIKVVNGRCRNRSPVRHEIEACTHWLEEEVRLVNPKLVVPLGVLAASAILGREVVMKGVHGEVLCGDRSVWEGRTIIPTYHPTGARTSEQRQAFRGDFDTIRKAYRGLGCD